METLRVDRVTEYLYFSIWAVQNILVISVHLFLCLQVTQEDLSTIILLGFTQTDVKKLKKNTWNAQLDLKVLEKWKYTNNTEN